MQLSTVLAVRQSQPNRRPGSMGLTGAHWGSLGLSGAHCGSFRAYWGSVGVIRAYWGSLGLTGAHRGSSGLIGAHRGSSGLSLGPDDPGTHLGDPFESLEGERRHMLAAALTDYEYLLKDRLHATPAAERAIGACLPAGKAGAGANRTEPTAHERSHSNARGVDQSTERANQRGGGDCACAMPCPQSMRHVRRLYLQELRKPRSQMSRAPTAATSTRTRMCPKNLRPGVALAVWRWGVCRDCPAVGCV